MLFTLLDSNITALANIFEKFGWPGLLITGAGFGLYHLIKHLLNKTTSSTNKALSDGFTDLSKSMKEQNERLLEAIIKQSEESSKTVGKVLDSVLTEKSDILASVGEDGSSLRNGNPGNLDINLWDRLIRVEIIAGYLPAGCGC